MFRLDRDLCTCANFTTDGKSLWYITETDYHLMCVDCSTGKTSYMGTVPEGNNGNHTYRSIFYVNQNVYILPYNSKKIWKYNIDVKNFEKLSIPTEMEEKMGDNARFFSAFLLKKEIVMFGVNPLIFRYDIDSDRCAIDSISPSFFTEKGVFFWKNGFTINEKVYLPIARTDSIIELDYNNHDIHFYTKGSQRKWFSTFILPYKNKICFVGIEESGDFIVDLLKIDGIDVERERLVEVKYAHNIDLKGHIPYSEGYIMGDRLILLPGYQQFGYEILLNQGICKEYSFIEESVSILCGIEIDGWLLAINPDNGTLIKKRNDCEEIDKIELYVDDEMALKIQQTVFNNKRGINREGGSVISLTGFINYIINNNNQ